MASISPTSLVLEPNQTYNFSQTGITSPVWTLDGLGTLSQAGLYTAPSTGGTAVVRAHDPFWFSVNGSAFTQNADDTLTKSTSTIYFYAQAKSNPKLNAIGDWVEFVVPNNNPYWIGVENDANTHRVVFFGVHADLMIYAPSGNLQITCDTWLANDLIKMELVAGGFLRVTRNGTTLYETTTDFSGRNLRFVVDGQMAASTVVRVPQFFAAGYSEVSAEIIISPPLPYGFFQADVELFCEANLMALSDGSSVSSFTDQSLNFRHLTAASSQPTFETNEINSKPVIRFNGSASPLSVTAAFTIRCGWVVAKFNGTSFSAYQGLLTDLVGQLILTSNNAGTDFFDAGYDLFEFRSNDRLYPDSAAPAPLNAFKLLFFRFWGAGLAVSGIRLGQDRDFTARKLNGDVALVALTSRNFTEEEIRARSAAIASAYGLTIADVYPYQADRNGLGESVAQNVLVYDPPEGARIAERVNDPKRLFELEFSSRRQAEIDAMKSFHADHYPEVACVYRNYNVVPPVDVEGYIDSPYELEGAINNFNYAFRFKET